jgi:hypothetical protein
MIIKLFENFKSQSELEQIINKYWFLDPYEFKDVILSSCDSAKILTPIDINFSVLYPYPDSNMDHCTMISFDGDQLKVGPWFDNLEGIIESERYELLIELWVDRWEHINGNDIEELYLGINQFLKRCEIPYYSAYPDFMDTHIYFEYRYTWEK